MNPVYEPAWRHLGGYFFFRDVEWNFVNEEESLINQVFGGTCALFEKKFSECNSMAYSTREKKSENRRKGQTSI